MMVGRQIELNIEKNPPQTGEVVLDVKNLKVLNVRHQVAVDNVSFEVHSGEVLGIAGVQGNGQTELVTGDHRVVPCCRRKNQPCLGKISPMLR